MAHARASHRKTRRRTGCVGLAPGLAPVRLVRGLLVRRAGPRSVRVGHVTVASVGGLGRGAVGGAGGGSSGGAVARRPWGEGEGEG